MPKPLSRKRVEEYDSDNGFVEDAPKSKKSKASAATGTSDAPSMQKDDEQNEFWEISRTRRVQVSEFKGATMIGIREFYEKDGKSLPGKKVCVTNPAVHNDFWYGNVEAYRLTLKIEDVLKAKGIDIPRPVYKSSGLETEAAEKEEDDQAEDEEEEEEEIEDDTEADSTVATKTGRLDKYKNKANHEATSDEGE